MTIAQCIRTQHFWEFLRPFALKEYVRSRVLLDAFFRALDSLVLLSIMSQPRIFSVKSVLKSDTKARQALFQSRS